MKLFTKPCFRNIMSTAINLQENLKGEKMKRLKLKLIVAGLVFLLTLIAMSMSVSATNQGFEVLRRAEGEYIIYIANNENTDFEFAFSGDSNVDRNTLNFRRAGTDQTGASARKIAYINDEVLSIFDETTYIWVRTSASYILQGARVDLSDAVSATDIERVRKITSSINVSLTGTIMLEEGENSVSVGRIEILDNGSHRYQIVRLPNTGGYNNFMILGQRMSRMNDNTDMATRISTYREFLATFDSLAPDITDVNWIDVEGNEIIQPADARERARVHSMDKFWGCNRRSIYDSY